MAEANFTSFESLVSDFEEKKYFLYVLAKINIQPSLFWVGRTHVSGAVCSTDREGPRR